MDIILTICVTKAGDRDRDLTFRKPISLAGVPHAGETIVVGRLRRRVDRVVWTPDSPTVEVVLVDDNDNSRGSLFELVCRKYLNLGFVADQET